MRRNGALRLHRQRDNDLLRLRVCEDIPVVRVGDFLEFLAKQVRGRQNRV